MVRKATFDDIELIEDTYNEHFKYEIKCKAFTIFKKGIYPTKKDAEKAISDGTLYVYEENNDIVGSIIINNVQPIEYTKIVWGQTLSSNEVNVIHLLIVRPSMARKGIATFLVKYAIELSKNHRCKALRLNTGNQNIPAVSLYKKLGFQMIATAPMKVGGIIEHNEHLFFEKALN